MIHPDDALRLILSTIHPTGEILQSLPQTAGRVLSRPLRARDSFPRFDNSAMDGYAVRAVDVRRARRRQPVRLKIIAESAAGKKTRRSLSPGTSIRISTGAMVPRDADSVIRQEDVRVLGNQIEVFSSIVRGENIRRKGEEILKGKPAAKAGTVLTPASIAWLAGLGIRHAHVHRMPHVVLMRSGDEVVEWNRKPRTDQVRDTHGLALSLALKELGVQPILTPILRDDATLIRRSFAVACRRCDVLITTGGVSVGPHDELPEVARRCGFRILFSKIAQKPGKPFIFGVRDHTYWFGLPGNPLSAVICFHLYIRPALLRMIGHSEAAPRWTRQKATVSIQIPKDKTLFFLGSQRGGWVHPHHQMGSHCLGAFTRSNIIIRIPPGRGSSTRKVEFTSIFP